MARDITQSFFMNEQQKDNRRYKADPYALQQFYKQSDAALEDTKKMIWLASMGLLDTVSSDSDKEAAGTIAYITNRQRYFQPKLPVFGETEPPPPPEVQYHEPEKGVNVPIEDYEERIPIPKLQALENYDLAGWNASMPYREWYKKAPKQVRKEIDAFSEFVNKYGVENIGRFNITTGTDATPITDSFAKTLLDNLSDDELKKITGAYGYSNLSKDDLLKLRQKNRSQYDKLFQNMLGYQRYKNLRGVLRESLKAKGLKEEQIEGLFADYEPGKHQYGRKKYNRAERFSRLGLEGGKDHIVIKGTRVGKAEAIYRTPDGKEIYREDPLAKTDLFSEYKKAEAIRKGMQGAGYNYKDEKQKETEDWLAKRVKEIMRNSSEGSNKGSEAYLSEEEKAKIIDEQEKRKTKK